jgi:hypothetical protein
MAIFGVIAVAIFMAAVAIGFTLDAKRGPLPIGFESGDECSLVAFTAQWAAQRVGRQDPRHLPLFSLGFRLSPYPIFYFLRAMSRSELEMLAPFIDEIIEGKEQPWNLPAEYVEWRPAVLAKFKTRMQREGLWPLSVRPT